MVTAIWLVTGRSLYFIGNDSHSFHLRSVFAFKGVRPSRFERLEARSHGDCQRFTIRPYLYRGIYFWIRTGALVLMWFVGVLWVRSNVALGGIRKQFWETRRLSRPFDRCYPHKEWYLQWRRCTERVHQVVHRDNMDSLVYRRRVESGSMIRSTWMNLGHQIPGHKTIGF